MRTSPIGATACMLLAVVGCYASSVLPTPAPERAVVRVRFDPPRRLYAASVGGDTLRLDGVTEVTDRVVAVRGDTLHVLDAAGTIISTSENEYFGSRR